MYKFIINWVNINEGFLMVSITVIYVLATIVICFFNGKSASASHKQVEEMKIQQKQNAGIQLYEVRKNILEKFSDNKFNEIFQDMPILFSNEINDKFVNVSDLYSQCMQLCDYLERFEEHLSENYDESVYKEFQRLQYYDNLPNSDEITKENLYTFCDDYFFTQQDPITQEFITYDYRVISEKILDLNKKIDSDKAVLFLEIQNFIKDSVNREIVKNRSTKHCC